VVPTDIRDQLQTALGDTYALERELGGVCVRGGRAQSDAARPLEERRRPGAEPLVSPYWLAIACAALGRHDEAFAALDHGFAVRDGWLIDLQADPALDPLRTDPRFARLLGPMGLGRP
jgi:hypothetical protein